MSNKSFRKKLLVSSFLAVAFLFLPVSNVQAFSPIPYVQNLVSSWWNSYYDSYTSELAHILYPIPSPEVVLMPTQITTPARNATHDIAGGPAKATPPPQGGEKSSPPNVGGVLQPKLEEGGTTKTVYVSGPQGPQGIPGPRGPSGSSANIDTSSLVSQTMFEKQLDGIFNSIERSTENLSTDLATLVRTNVLTVVGNATVGGQLTVNRVPTLAHNFSSFPTGTSNVADASLYINPASSIANGNLIGAAIDGVVKFLVDAEGDIYGNNLILAGTTTTGATTVAGSLDVQGNTTLGDAITDTITVTGRFNSDLLPLTDDVYNLGSTANRWASLRVGTGASSFAGNVGIGTTGPGAKVEILSTGTGTTLGQLDTNLRLTTQTSTANAGNEISFSGSGGTLAQNIYAAISAPVVGNTSGAAGYLAFSTKALIGTSGLTERLRITETGNVGIGTTSPTNKLVVQNGTLGGSTGFDTIPTVNIIGNNITSRSSSTVQQILYLHQPNTFNLSKGSAFGVGLSYWEDAGSNYPRTRVDFQTTGRTTDSVQAGNTVMSLRDDGNVGIGTTNPAAILHVKTAASTSGGILVDTTTAGTNQSRIDFADAGTTKWLLGQNAANSFFIYDNAAARNVLAATNSGNMALMQSGGNVGIGETAPGAKLHVAGSVDGMLESLVTNNSSGVSSRADITAADGSGSIRIVQFGDNHSLANQGWLTTSGASNALVLGTVGAERVRITTTGNVGIGTSTPHEKLEVNGGQLRVGNSTDGIVLDYAAGLGAIRGFDVAAAGYNDLGLYTGSSPSVYIKTDGNVGIGTTGPADILHLTTGNLRIGASTAVRATTAGTNQLILFDGTAPVGTLTNGISMYSTAGEAYIMDAAGNATLQSPHENENNYWVFDSKNSYTGKSLIVDMELMMKKLNETFGWDFVHETINGVETPRNEILSLDLKLAGIEERLALLEAQGGLQVASVILEKLTTKELCLDDICINKEQLKELLEKNNINQNNNSQENDSENQNTQEENIPEAITEPVVEETPNEDNPIITEEIIEEKTEPKVEETPPENIPDPESTPTP